MEQANPAFHALLGAEVGHNWLDSVHPDDRPAVQQAWDAALKAAERIETVFRLKPAGPMDDGEVLTGSTAATHDAQPVVVCQAQRHVEVQAAVLRNAEGQATQLVGVAENISRRMAHQQAERDQARHAAVRHLTGGLAQNLNNILTVMLGNAELLNDQLPPSHALHRTARMSLTATERAATLVRRLMAYAGHGTLFPGP